MKLEYHTVMKYFMLTLLYVSAVFLARAIELPFYQSISLNHDDGLCDDYVRHIAQDVHGYVWVVTNHGLNRFDGNGFRKFTKENSGLTTNELNCVLQDPVDADRIWIGSRLNGLFCYDYATGKISCVDIPLHTPDITALSVSSDNQIWITHYNFPPEKFNPVNMELKRLFPSRPEDFPSRIWCSVVDAAGIYMYLGHESFGLSKINLLTKEYELFPAFGEVDAEGKSRSVYSLHIDGDYLWIGTDDGVYKLDLKTGAFSRPDELPESQPYRMGPVKTVRGMADGTIWAGTARGISLFSTSSGLAASGAGMGAYGSRSLGFPVLSASAPSVIFEDTYGNKWVGYNGHGLDVLNSAMGPVSYYRLMTDDGKARYETPVWSIMCSSFGDVWLGGEYSVTRVSKGSRRSYALPLNQPQAAPVRCIYEDPEGSVWLGTFNSGAFLMRRGEAGFSPVKGIDREIRSLVCMPGFGMLAATHDGIYRMGSDGTAVPFKLINSQLYDFYVTSLLVTSQGGLLAGTFGHGVVGFDSKGNRTYMLDKKDGLPSSTVNDIKEGPDGKVWIATRDGVVKCDGRGLRIDKVIRTDDGIHSSNFKAIECGSDGRIWISAEDGIACFDPETDRLSFFNRANKRSLSGFVEGSSGSTADGKLLFGSLGGMYVLSLGGSSSSAESSPMRVSELLANDAKGSDPDVEVCLPVSSGHIEIPYNLNTFTIKFSTPDVSKNINSEIRYNMKGVNDVWTTSDSRNEAVYRNLKPGKYEFQVSTRYFGGDWTDPETILTVSIVPPLYLTWWAKVIYVLLFLGFLAIVFNSYRYKVNLEKNLEIEKENSRVTKMLHEEKLMFYTNVTHELRTPLSLIIGPIEDLINSPDMRDDYRSKLHTVRSSSIRLLNLINGILEFRKTETRNRSLAVVYGNLANLVREITLRFKELNNNRNVSFVIDVSQMEGRDVYYDPEIITTILNNLIGNATKYTREGVISVSLKPIAIDGVDYFDLVVADTGEGIEEKELPYIFKRYYQGAHNRNVGGTGIGLALVRSLVEIHEAEINVRSEVGKGSVFTVRFVADNTYPAARHKESDRCVDIGTAVPGLPESDGIAPDRLTVLVVEDDEDVRAYIETSLSALYNVLTAEDGEKGWLLVKKHMPDIVVSDIMMPKINGIELCGKIKSDDAVNHIPVIILTAKDSILDKEEGYNSGADSYITKPFSSKLLLARIRNIIEGRHRMSIRYIVDGLADRKREDAGDGDEVKVPGGKDALQKNLEDNPMVRNSDGSRTLSAVDREFIDRFRKLIEEYITREELDIPFLTDKMCMSHSTLYRKVKSITGLTPNEFTRKIKLARAAELLLAGEDLVKVTDLTGFSSTSYFRRVFKKEFGLSPVEYVQEKFVNHNDG